MFSTAKNNLMELVALSWHGLIMLYTIIYNTIKVFAEIQGGRSTFIVKRFQSTERQDALG